MKLLFYISTIEGGGAARVMTNLANHFSEDLGFDAKVYLLTNYKSEVEYELSTKVKRFSIDESPNKDNVLRKNIRRCKYLRKLIKKIEPDMVISFMQENDIRNYISSIGIKRVQTVMSVRNDPKILFDNKLKKLIFKFIYNRADGVVFQTEEAMRWFGNGFRPLSKVIINQTAEKFYETERDAKPQGIVTLGSYLPKKNHKLLIQAYSKIADSIKDDLYIYGTGNLENEYIKLIDALDVRNRVHLCEVSNQPEKILAKARVFVLSSDHEGMPNALLEALAVGIPCISTDCPCGGPSAVIRTMENGILVPVNDVDSLAEAMRIVLSDDDLQIRLGTTARKRALSFKPDVIYNEWKNFFLELGGMV